MAIQYNEETKTLILTSPEDLEAKEALEQHVSAEHIVFGKDISIIPKGINGILKKFENLESIQGDGVVTVGVKAFIFLQNLKTVALPNAKTIEANAFAKCSKLSTIDLRSVVTIGAGTFLVVYN